MVNGNDSYGNNNSTSKSNSDCDDKVSVSAAIGVMEAAEMRIEYYTYHSMERKRIH